MSIKKQSEQQIYGRNDMVNIEPNKKIYGSLGKTEKWFFSTVEGNPVTMANSRNGSFEKEVTEFDLYGWSEQETTTGKNLSSIKNCQLSANMVSSDIVPWTKKDRIYFSCDTENVDGSKIYVLCRYYNESKICVGANGTILLADGIRKEISFRGVGASSHGGNVDLTTIEYVNIEIGLPSASTAASSIDNIMVCDEENQTYEPYTGGKPSPSPEYPQEIVSVGQKLSTGKNLINADDYYSEYKQTNGMYKVDDVKLNDIIIIFDSGMVGKTYTASCNLNCPNTVSSVALEVTIDGKKVLGNIIPTNKSGISEIMFTPKTVRDSIKITYGTGRGDIIFSDFQIEAGSFATSYEPYTGGVPTLYQKDIEVRVTGKNLFDANDVSKGYVSDDTGNNIVATNSYCSNFIAVSAKTKYYLYSGQDGGRWGAFYDSNKTFISGISTDKYNSVFETPENAAYIRFTVDYNNNNPDFARNVIFAKSTIAVPFEPYHEPQSLSISTPTGLPAIPVDTDGNYTDVNGQQWIADYIDLKRGKLVKKLKRFTISDVKTISTWGVNENTDNITGFYFYTSENGLPKTNNDVMVSTILQYGSSTWGGKNVGCAMSSDIHNNYAILSVPTNMLEDISSDENACASLVKICENTNAIFFYSMAYPIETDLTPEEIEQYKKLRTKAPTTIIENNYNTWMKVTYKSTESV